MTLSFQPLGEVCEVIAGQSPPSKFYNKEGDGLPFFQGKADFRELYPSVRMWCSEPKKVAEVGDILISVRAPVGPTNLANQQCCIGRGLSAIRVTEKTHAKFLLHYLRYIEPKLSGRGRGSTFSAITQKDLRAIQIPVPPLAEQRRIAAILDKADALRAKRRAALAKLDTLLQATFLTMFGDPDSTFSKVKVATVVQEGKGKIRTGPFGSQLLHSEFIDDPNGVMVLGIDNAVQNRFVYTNNRYISQEKYEQLRRYTVNPDDVLITIMGTCGRCSIVPNDIPLAINTKHLCCITLDQIKCLPIYLKFSFLLHPYVLKQLGVSERGAVMPGLNMGIIKNLSIPLPSIELQTEFATFVNKLERHGKRFAESSEKLDNLFHTLQQRAFKGQL